MIHVAGTVQFGCNTVGLLGKSRNHNVPISGLLRVNQTHRHNPRRIDSQLRMLDESEAFQSAQVQDTLAKKIDVRFGKTRESDRMRYPPVSEGDTRVRG